MLHDIDISYQDFMVLIYAPGMWYTYKPLWRHIVLSRLNILLVVVHLLVDIMEWIHRLNKDRLARSVQRSYNQSKLGLGMNTNGNESSRLEILLLSGGCYSQDISSQYIQKGAWSMDVI